MNHSLKILSLAALAAILVACTFYATSRLALPTTHAIVLLSTILWFVVTPWWMGRPSQPDAEHTQI